MGQRNPRAIYVVALLFAVLFMLAMRPAQAQNYSTFINNMFQDLYAEPVSCAALGLDERPYDFSTCGWIDDNLVDTNKRIIEHNIREHGYTIVNNWKRDGQIHQIGYMKAGVNAVFIVNYGELGPVDSIVWVIGNYF